MQIWMTIVLAAQLLAALAMIGLVLMQHGKGADMGASFGSGASGSLFGATGSANFLSRSTAVLAGIFFACTLALALMSNAGYNRKAGEGGSVLDKPAAAASAAAGAIPTAAIPAAASAAATPATPSVPAPNAAIPAPVAPAASK